MQFPTNFVGTQSKNTNFGAAWLLEATDRCLLAVTYSVGASMEHDNWQVMFLNEKFTKKIRDDEVFKDRGSFLGLWYLKPIKNPISLKNSLKNSTPTEPLTIFLSPFSIPFCFLFFSPNSTLSDLSHSFDSLYPSVCVLVTMCVLCSMMHQLCWK